MPILPTITPIEHLPEKTLLAELFGDFTEEQEAYKSAHGKYEQKIAVTENGVTKEVHEYVCPDGSVGWLAKVRQEIDGKEMVKSFGVGPETKARSHDWLEVKDLDYGVK